MRIQKLFTATSFQFDQLNKLKCKKRAIANERTFCNYVDNSPRKVVLDVCYVNDGFVMHRRLVSTVSEESNCAHPKQFDHRYDYKCRTMDWTHDSWIIS